MRSEGRWGFAEMSGSKLSGSVSVERCDRLAGKGIRVGVAGSVRDELIRDPAAIPDLPRVAAALLLSSRTLSRRLNAEGTSFRALVDEVRRARSEQLLGHTRLTTEQVASRLGYAESASFIRAFRRWNGCPPQEFRSRGGHSG
ncbi:AraC-type DNA-binding protein [Nocardia amikacinitolerans]|nr:AraC-type DNA-binding protein [Nocardia amikacinitolerans]